MSAVPEAPTLDPAVLTRQLRGDDGPGFLRLPGFAAPEAGEAMLDEVVSIARAVAAGESVDALVMKESQPDFRAARPEDLVSKIFRLHRRPRFGDFLRLPRVAELLAAAIGPDVDCFLSQFIFKNPGAWGQRGSVGRAVHPLALQLRA